MAIVPACGACPEHRCPYAWSMRVVVRDDANGATAVLCGRHGRSATPLRIVSDRFLEADPKGTE